MTKRRHSRVSFDGFAIPVRHAHWAYLAGEAYNYFTKKQKMAPINTRFASKAFHDESYGGIATSSESWVNVKCGNAPLKRVTKNNIGYRDQYSTEFEWVSNTARHVTIYALGCKEQYTTVTPDSQFNRSTCFYTPAFGLQTDQYVTGGLNVDSVVSTNVNNWMGLSNGTVYMDFLNQTTLPCFIKVHWYKCLRTTNLNPSSIFADAVADNNSYSDNYVFPTTVSSATAGGNEVVVSNTNGSASVYGSLVSAPYTNIMSRKDVWKDWKRLKTKTFSLQNGASHRMTVNHVLNMFQCGSYLNSTLIFPVGSLVCQIEMQGAPSHLREAVETPTYDGPTIGPGKISVVVTRKVNCKPLKSSQERFDLTYVGRGNVLSNGTIPNTNVIEDVDMQPQQGERLQ